MTQDTEIIFIALAVVGGLFALVVMIMRGQKRAEQAKRWPTAEVTIQSAGMELVNWGGRSKVELPVYAFSYVVAGEYYSGRFSLQAGEAPPSGTLKWELVGTKTTVHYDPKRPSTFSFADGLIAGCGVSVVPD